MKILYLCTQPPGHGGASTETYEAIKRLREAGCTVAGLFIVARSEERALCDPDNIGDITAVTWSRRDDPHLLAGDYDILIGKNYEAGWVIRKRSDVPTVYLTSGIDHISHYEQPASELNEPLPPEGVDVRAFTGAKYALVHSTLDLDIYRRFLPPHLFSKIVDGVIFTPNIAVPPLDRSSLPEYEKRQFDLCFSASSWTRIMKNPALLREMCARLSEDCKIVVCGNDFEHPNVYCPGLVAHSQMVEILKQSRVVPIPSRYDPSPNLYPEAIYAGCNVIVSPNVGNIEHHPSELLAQSLAPDDFERAIRAALSAKKQLRYQTPTPEEATAQLLGVIQKIVTSFKQVTAQRPPERYDPTTLERQNVQSSAPSGVEQIGRRHGRPKFCVSPNALIKTPPTPEAEPEKQVSPPRQPLGDAQQNLRSTLRCPRCKRQQLNLEPGVEFSCPGCGQKFSLVRGVVEFETGDSHVSSFSVEWNRWSRVQVDSHGYCCGYQGFTNSHDTFWKKMGLQPDDLIGKIVLDGGCGVGRFTEVAAETAWGVLAVDLSEAVYHAAELMVERQFGHTMCLKANLEHLPLIDNCVDIAFTLGVAHHSPNPPDVFRELIRVVKPSGILCGWVYAKHNSYGSPEREAVRRFTTDPKNIEWVQAFAEMAPALRNLSIKGRWDELREVLGISSSANDAECVLDTFDWLTPRHQFQYTNDEIVAMLTDLGLVDIQLQPFPVSFKAKKS